MTSRRDFFRGTYGPWGETIMKLVAIGLGIAALLLLLWNAPHWNTAPPWRPGAVQSILIDDGVCSVVFQFETGTSVARIYYENKGAGYFNACARLVQGDRIKFREWKGMDSWGVYILGKDAR